MATIGGYGMPPPDDGDPRTRMQWEAARRGVGFADLDRIWIDPSSFAALPVVLQRDWEAIPVKLDGTTLYVAVPDLEADRRARIEAFTGLRVVLVLGLPEAMEPARRRALAEEGPA